MIISVYTSSLQEHLPHLPIPYWEMNQLGKILQSPMWVIAGLGIVFKIFFTGRFEFVSLASYLGMGWLGYLMFGRLGEVLGQESVNLMLYGGLSYTTGVVFYVWRNLKYHHAAWHLFVLSGTVFHTIAIIRVL